jgi:hypothetical protein
VSYRLICQNDPDQKIQINSWTWFGILELAMKFGWNPRGTVTPENLEMAGIYSSLTVPWQGSYWGRETRLVLFEDALNLADALDEAFIKVEPRRLPSLHPFHLNAGNGDLGNPVPAIGVIQMMIGLCQQGAFLIVPI